MACAIHLVTEIEVRPFPLGFYDLIIAVQIAIGLLCRGDERNHLLSQGLQLTIRRAAKLPPECLQPFIDVLICKIHAAITA